MDRVLIVSADGHAGGPPELYRPYLEARFQGELDALIADNELWVKGAISQARFTPETLEIMDGSGAIRSGGEVGAYDFQRRVQELDREGVAAELLIPAHQAAITAFFGHVNHRSSRELRAAGARANHRQLADAMVETNGRLYGVAESGPCIDMDETVRELKWVAAHGFPAVTPPANVLDESMPPITDPYYEPFWATCADVGLVLTAHVGYGVPPVGPTYLQDRFDRVMSLGGPEPAMTVNIGAAMASSSDQMPRQGLLSMARPRRLLWQLMLAGVFDRYPTLKVVITECRAEWVAPLLAHLDAEFEAGNLPTRRRPSEYWSAHCAVAPSSPRAYEIADRDNIGVGNLLFGMDFPHPEGTWPNTREWLRTVFAGVPEIEARQILGGNAVEIYGLDRPKLTAIADRIGLTTAEIFSGEAVDPRLLNQFHARSGFALAPDAYDPTLTTELLSDDLRTKGISA
ncbi:MAG: putative amidohydrolase [Acidimicrobiia bacterium]|nr:putative amidohydrolase [Acidimicrobiia bacterium]